MSVFSDLLGTTKTYFKLGLSGVRLKNNSGNLAVRDTNDSADAEITASKVNVSGNAIDINSDAANSGADWKYTLARPASGMSANVTLTLPIDDGTAGQVLYTDGNGALGWVASGNTDLADKVDTTTLDFGSTSPLAMFNTGATDIINYIEVVVDTAFNGGSPTISIGVSGGTSKYSATSEVDLKTTGAYLIHPALTAQGIEALIVTYAASSSTAGSARILVHYCTPA